MLIPKAVGLVVHFYGTLDIVFILNARHINRIGRSDRLMEVSGFFELDASTAQKLPQIVFDAKGLRRTKDQAHAWVVRQQLAEGANGAAAL